MYNCPLDMPEASLCARAEEAKAELSRISATPQFRRAPKRLALLTCLFQQSLHDCEPDERKIAKSVFGITDLGKKTNVRVALNDLRKNLVAHYEAEGRDSVYELRIPKGRTCVQYCPRTRVQIPLGIVSRFLRAMCRELDWSDAKKDQCIRDWLQTGNSIAVLPYLQASLRDIESITLNSFLDALQRRETLDALQRREPSCISFRDLSTLTDVFQIHRLLVDPLRSQEAAPDVTWLRLGMDDDFFRVGEQGEKTYGHQTKYCIPGSRLSLTDAAFVRLDLAKRGGHSDYHDHVGDEFVIVLQGAVEIQFENNGMRTALKKGDFMHFYAEQRHCAVSLAAKSRLFIIRFYQMDEHFIRQRMRREVEIRHESHGHAAVLSRLTLGWVYQAIESETVEVPDRVYDKVGLARFLSALREAGFLGPSRELLDVLPSHGVKPEDLIKKRDWLSALEESRDQALIDQLPDIAKVYGVETFLLYNFLFPGVPNAVVIRDGKDSDWRPVLAKQGEDGDRMHYVPRRNLAFSDIAVTKLILQPHSVGKWNRHPGCELLLPLRGKATLHFGSEDSHEPVCTVAENDLSIVHYFSSLKHCIANESAEPCEVLVIRFFFDGLRHTSLPGIASDRTKLKNRSDAARRSGTQL